ncbi:leucine-rich_repeat domain-containing protein [Hexamita inflata]|uniref:Leucine-rich repeat domain-containing protein n=1 Tax=Hexamita inflata TaxID=28002 RepID=A0AA86NUW8_9EUKA|nr:leucine-rich repeat domain-containing protein [Hexamita inflata]
MTTKYEYLIQEGNLVIGEDPDLINLKFLEKFNIITLKLFISQSIRIQLQNKSLTELTVQLQTVMVSQQVLNLKIDDLELENLEVLLLEYNNMNNDQLYNIVKFKKLHTLDVSKNSVDLTHIHSVTSLTKLSMRQCGLKNIELISSLVNLEDLDISYNDCIDLSPLQNVTSLTKLVMQDCALTNIDQIVPLTNLRVLDLSKNLLQNIDSIGQLKNLTDFSCKFNYNIDITSLQNLVGLINLDLRRCNLRQLGALKPLINLQFLDISRNSNINITELQYLRSLTHLYLFGCSVASIYVLRPLVSLENLNIAINEIVYLDANLCKLQNLKLLKMENNLVSDFSSIETHHNFDNVDKYGYRGFNIQNQKTPSLQQLNLANKMKRIEDPNISLKENKIKHKTLKTKLKQFQLEINALTEHARSNYFQFTFSIAHLFEQLNKTVSQ